MKGSRQWTSGLGAPQAVRPVSSSPICNSSCAISETTISAPSALRASALPLRSIPMINPKPPARAAATPAIASSTTTTRGGALPSCRAASRKLSGAGFPFSDNRLISRPVTATSNRPSSRATLRISSQFRLADTTAVLRPSDRSRRISATVEG